MRVLMVGTKVSKCLLAAKAAPISRNVRSLVSQSVSQSVSQLVNKLKKHSKAWLKLSKDNVTLSKAQ